jgi:hypothetical protein
MIICLKRADSRKPGPAGDAGDKVDVILNWGSNHSWITEAYQQDVSPNVSEIRQFQHILN